MNVAEVDRIRDEEFLLFKTSVQKFYRGREEKYFKSLKDKYGKNKVPTKDLYKKEAKDYFATLPKELLSFIKDYIDNRLNTLVDDVRAKKILKKEAEVSLEVLKHILLAGEQHTDKEKVLK
jgi:hypothetical protein